MKIYLRSTRRAVGKTVLKKETTFCRREDINTSRSLHPTGIKDIFFFIFFSYLKCPVVRGFRKQAFKMHVFSASTEKMLYWQ